MWSEMCQEALTQVKAVLSAPQCWKLTIALTVDTYVGIWAELHQSYSKKSVDHPL